jgi:drug/metabolite transporter (DMT)-like permease
MNLTPPWTPSRRRLPLPLVLGLAAAIVLDTATQVMWKRAASSLPENIFDHPVGAVLHILQHPVFLIVAVLFVAQLMNWLKVLHDADLSFALPITALSYVTVAAVSAFWLHEQITWGRAAGMACILFGVFLISRTDHNTLNPPGPL